MYYSDIKKISDKIIEKEILEKYSNIGNTIFYYCVKKVNPVIYPVLSIELFDPMSTSYGSYIFPNRISIYLGEILNFSKHYYGEYNDSYIKTCLCLVCLHELIHINQCLDSEEYSTNDYYRRTKEKQAETESMLYLLSNNHKFETMFDFTIDLSFIYINDEVKYIIKNKLPFSLSRMYNIEFYIYQLLYDICGIKETVFKILNTNKDIMLTFYSHTNISILIKRNGEYVNITEFANIAYDLCLQFNKYSVLIEADVTSSNTREVNITVKDMSLDDAMVFHE